jgi:hypothetical protein
MASSTPLKKVPLILRLLLTGGAAHIGFPRGIVGTVEQIAAVHPVGLRAEMVDHLVREGVNDLRAVIAGSTWFASVLSRSITVWLPEWTESTICGSTRMRTRLQFSTGMFRITACLGKSTAGR